MHSFTDTVVMDRTSIRSDGSLVADARVARTGIQLYLGSELGQAEKYIRVYRPGSEVFSEDSVATLAHRPVTNDHPPEMVDAKNWKKYAVGQTADEIVGESMYLRVPLMVSDAAAIADINTGKRELSCGYTCDVDFTPGTTPDGETYDAVQRNIRYNHVAIVRRGRAGSEVRIGDSAEFWGTAPVESTLVDNEETGYMPENLRTVVVDGLSVTTTDQGAQAITKLESMVRDAATTLQTTKDEAATEAARLGAEVATRDTKIGELQAELKTLQDAQLDAAALDKLVAQRAALVATARAVDADVVVDGKTDTEIRRAVCAKKLGDASVVDASDDAVLGMFSVISRDAKSTVDPVRDALIKAPGVTTVGDSETRVNDARAKMLSDLSSAHAAVPAKGAQV